MFAKSLDPRLHKPVVVGLRAFFNPQSALASQARCRARACVGVEIEPMFSVEAKKRQQLSGKDHEKLVANLPPVSPEPKARQEAKRLRQICLKLSLHLKPAIRPPMFAALALVWCK